MEKNSVKSRASAEVKELTRLLTDYGVSDNKIRTLKPIIENVAWMKVKLDDARDSIGDAELVAPYDNGGGQTGERENPEIRGYENLWKSYMAGLNKLLDAVPARAEMPEQEEARPQTVLSMVRDRHRKDA